MTKKEVLDEFKETVLPSIKAIEAKQSGGVDKCLRAEEWNNYTDMLCKEGRITSKQYYFWSNPF